MGEGERSSVGETADAGYQIGVRRTLTCSAEQLWDLLLSGAGTRVWLGGAVDIAEGTRFSLDDGTSGMISVFRSGSHIRLTWQPLNRPTPTTLQIRVIPAKTGTTLAIHQERLRDGEERTAMRAHWRRVIEELSGRLPA